MTRACVVLGAWSKFGDERNFGPLEQTLNGANELRTAFAVALAIAPEEITLCLDKRREDFLEAIHDSAADPSLEALVVHVASHGIPDGNRLYLANNKSTSSIDLFRALSVDEVFNAMAFSPATSKVLLIDSCFSGSAAGLMSHAQGGLETPPVRVPEFTIGSSPGGIFVLTSCSGSEVSFAPVGERFTVFTEALLEVLTGDESGPGNLTSKHLYRAISERISERNATEGRSYPLPRYHDSDGIGDRPLFINPRYSGTPPEVIVEPVAEPNYRILVVDDIPELVDDLVGRIEDLGRRNADLRLSVIGRTDEAEAQAALEEYFDLAIVDLFLQHGTAAALLHNAKRGSPNTRTIVLTTSTRISPGDLDQALPAIIGFPPSVDGLLIKGPDQGRVLSVIRREARRRNAVLGKLVGVQDLVGDVLDRLRRRRRVPDGVSAEALAIEVRATVAGLFAQWLDSDAWPDGVDPLIETFSLSRLDEGRSSCVVYEAAPSVAVTGGVAPTLLAAKIGPRSEIDQELDRYHRYVEVGIPLRQRTDLVAHWLGRNVGGILYSFIGSASRSAQQALSDGDYLNALLVNLFAPENISWYAIGGLPQQQLSTYYAQFGFGPNEAYMAIDELASSVSSLNTGLSREAALPMPNSYWLGNEYLCKSWPTTLIHGDLHLGNVVSVGERGEFAVIDYRNVGPGPRCVDFAAAELSLLLRSSPDDRPQGQLAAELVTWLAGSPAGSNDLPLIQRGGEQVPAPDWLSGVAPHLVVLRGFLNRTFSGPPVITPREYFACLFMVALRRSRFRGLARGKSEERRERIVMSSTVIACASRLGIL